MDCTDLSGSLTVRQHCRVGTGKLGAEGFRSPQQVSWAQVVQGFPSVIRVSPGHRRLFTDRPSTAEG